MKRRDFLSSSIAAGLGGIVANRVAASASSAPEDKPQRGQSPVTRKILISGGNFGTAFIRYMAELIGAAKPKLLYLPTASADNQAFVLNWYRACAGLNVEPYDQASFVESGTQKRSWDEVLLSADGIVTSGGNTLNQQAIWRAQGMDVVLKQAWNRGIVLGGASAARFAGSTKG